MTFWEKNHSVIWYSLQFFKTFLAFGSERRFVKIEGFLSSFSALRVFSRREQCFEKNRFSKKFVLMFPVSCGKKRFRVLGVLFRVSFAQIPLASGLNFLGLKYATKNWSLSTKNFFEKNDLLKWLEKISGWKIVFSSRN